MAQTQVKPRNVLLVEDPLTSNNRRYLEEILEAATGYTFLNAVQYGSLGGNFGVPTNSDREPLGTFLPGGIIIRARYHIADIRKRF